MVNCNARSFTGATAQADAETFIETIDEAKFLGITSYTTANSPTITVVYKT
jgi:hypothetical protein